MRWTGLLLMLLLGACASPEEGGGRTAAPAPAAPEGGLAAEGAGQAVADTASFPPLAGLPLGLDYETVRARYPDVGALAPGPGAGLAEAMLDRPALGRPAVLELNFEEEQLYSYYLRLDTLACDVAEALYGRVQRHYTAALGAGREEVQDEGAYRAATRYWEGDGFAVAATRSRQGDGCRLAWGVQAPQP